jgi:hypothetical protein
MHRMAGLLVIIWLAASAPAQAQTFSQGVAQSGTISGANTPATTTNAAALPQTPCSTSGSSFIGSLSMALSCESGSTGAASSNAVSSNASTSFTGGAAAGSTTTGFAPGAAAPGISASASLNPQAAVQLPGESSNTSTQGANTTASSAGSGRGASSTMPCSPAIPSTTGTGASAGELFGAASLGGC